MPNDDAPTAARRLLAMWAHPAGSHLATRARNRLSGRRPPRVSPRSAREGGRTAGTARDEEI